MWRITRAATVGLTIVLAALVLAACGSDGGGDAGASGGGAKSATPVALVSDTFGSKQTVESGKLDVSFKLDAEGLQGVNGPIAVRLRGPFEEGKDGSLPSADLDLDVAAGPLKIAAGLVSVDGGLWIEYGGTAYVLPASVVKQYENAYDKAEKQGSNESVLASLGLDPSTWIENATVVGDEQLGSDETTRVSADIDIAALLADVGTALSKAGSPTNGVTLPKVVRSQGTPKLDEQTRKDIERSITSAKLEVWTGKDDHILRRLRVAIAFDVPKSAQDRAQGLTTGSLTLDVAVTDVNEDQSITAPANARPFSELQPLLTGVLGA